MSPNYDALLIVSFGGPEGPDDVLPFLRNVTRGRDIPLDRLAEVAEHYYARGGVSPLNENNRRLQDALASQLDVPVYCGNRNWHPFLVDTVRIMRDEGVRNALAFITSPYASYSSCRHYLEDIATARAHVGEDAPRVERLRHYFDHPGFIAPFVESTVEALGKLETDPAAARLMFTAHSIPTEMAEVSGPNGGLYVAQLQAAMELVTRGVADAVGVTFHADLVFQSRSGAPGTPWLGPDLLDYLSQLDAAAVLAVPIGFTADHMEVVHDLDVEAAAVARERGIAFVRAATPGTHPAFAAMIADLVRERREPEAPRLAMSPLGPSYDDCPVQCCLGRR